LDVRDSRVHNYPPRWNGAPSQELLVIRRNHNTGEVSLDPLRWALPTFRDAYQRRRCIVPEDGFFEWKAIKGQKATQPYVIAMKDGSPFGLSRLWKTGKTRRPPTWFPPSRSSRRTPTSWWLKSTIACR
jgi:putative SOS response-associated peptidase YedK